MYALSSFLTDSECSENCSSHTRNEEDDAFDHQLDKWGVERVFSEHPEPVKRELIAYIENWGKCS